MGTGYSDIRNQSGPIKDEEIVGLVRTRKEHAARSFQAYYAKIARWYDLYRGLYSGRFAYFRNNVHIPFIYSVIQSDVARKVQTSLGSWPIVNFDAIAPEDIPNARRNEVLISTQMKDSRSFMKAVDFYTTANMYGVGIARHGWLHKARYEKFRVPYEFAPGVRKVELVNRNVTYFDGPDWSVVDTLDFFPQPGFKFIDDMAWVVERYYLDLDRIEEMEQPDADGNPGYFDKGTADKLRDKPMQGGEQNEMGQRVSVYRTWGDYQSRVNEKFSKPVEIWEMWGIVPKEMSRDGVLSRCIAIGNGRALMKDRPQPYWHGQKPYLAYQVGEPHYFHGIGKAELMHKMQAVANRLINHKLDSLDLVISPMWVVNGQANVNVQNLYSSPGKIIQVDGDASENTIRPLVPEREGILAADQGIETMWRYMQQGSGIVEDTVSGLPSANRQTAREFQGRQENVMTRLMLEARIAEEQFIEPLANMFRQLNRQYLPLPKELSMMGSLATTDPYTGLPNPPERVRIDHEDMWPDYKARAVGATQMLGKSLRQQNIMSMLQACSSNPSLMQLINWAMFAREMFQIFDFKNVNELLVQQVPAVNQLADQAGMPPQQMAQGIGQMAQNPESLSPQLLQQMLQQHPQETMQ